MATTETRKHAGVGNDVVDLDDPDAAARPLEGAFVRRVCTQTERAFLQAESDSTLALWMLWSAKEAVFKQIQRGRPSMPFAHRCFEVSVDRSRVHFEQVDYPVHWTVRGRCLMCTTGHPSNTITAVSTLDGTRASHVALSARELESATGEPSRGVRKLAKAVLAQALELPIADLEIIRSPSRGRGATPWLAPEVHHRGSVLKDVSVSLSHHGRYVACTLAEGALA